MVKQQSTVKRVLNIALTAAGSILSVILILNVTLIIKSELNKNEPPSLFGFTPLIPMSGSMTGEQADSFSENDVVIIRAVSPAELKTNDVIAFYDGDEIITHRIIETEKSENGETVFVTKGDANNTEDTFKVNESEVIGRLDMKLAGMGGMMDFLQTPASTLLLIGLPLAAVLIFDMIRGKKSKPSDPA